MSGQPNINPLDPAKFRSAYMANLNLRAQLDDVNLQANKVYQRTGQLPVEVTDNRTTAEKLMDIQRLRIEARHKLKEIADGVQANKISQEMTPREVVFYAQQSPLINNLIRMRYAQGVLSDIFIPYLQSYMSESAGNSGVASGLQQTSGPNIILNAANIIKGVIDPANIDALLEVTMNRVNTPTRNAMETAAKRLKNLLPRLDIHLEIDKVGDAMTKNDLLHALNGALREFPSKYEAVALVNEYMRFRANNDATLQEKTIGRMLQSLTISPDSQAQMEYIQRKLSSYKATARAMGVENIFENQNATLPTGVRDLVREPDEFASLSTAAMEAARTGAPMGDQGFDENNDLATTQSALITETLEEGVPDEDVDLPAPEAMETDDRGNFTEAIIDGMSDEALRSRIQALNVIATGLKVKKPNAFSPAAMGRITKVNDDIKDYLKDKLTSLNSFVDKINKASSGSGFKGRSPNRSNDRPLPDASSFRGKGLGRGVKATERFVPFGRYIINQHRLNSDIIAVKRASGSCLKSFPSCRVGGKLGIVMRKIVGGGIPAFEDFESLNDGERSYLHKLAKSANILEKLSIPAPNKDANQKMTDEFEVMKGEIMAGNDNKDMIKKFKILILKLSNSQLLPKSQVREILVDLASMGF